MKDIKEPLDIPQGAKGNEGIFNVLKRNFAGHDMEAIIKTLGSTSEARFMFGKQAHNQLRQREPQAAPTALSRYEND